MAAASSNPCKVAAPIVIWMAGASRAGLSAWRTRSRAARADSAAGSSATGASQGTAGRRWHTAQAVRGGGDQRIAPARALRAEPHDPVMLARGLRRPCDRETG